MLVSNSRRIINPMKTYIIGFFAVSIPMLALDAIWLMTMIKTFYTKYVGELFAAKPSFAPAAVFYLLYTIGVLYFVVLPLLRSNASYTTIFFTGAFLGLIAYGTYDLTNQATLKNWPTIITLVDLAWGALLTGTVSAIAVWIMKITKAL